MSDKDLICDNCNREFKYKKSYDKHIIDCGKETNIEVKTVTDDGSDVIITPDNIEVINYTPEQIEEIEKEVSAEVKKIEISASESNKVMSQKEFIQYCSLIFDETNGFLNSVPKDSRFYELAQIWVFTDEEIVRILRFIYNVIKRYFPEVYKNLTPDSMVFIVISGISVVMIFGKKVGKTAIWGVNYMKEIKEKKKNESETKSKK